MLGITRTSLRALAALVIAIIVTAGLLTAPVHASQQQGAKARGAAVLRVASALKGTPYRYGADGPRAFDCSGYTMWVYRKALGKRLPRTSDAQARATKRVSRSSVRRGDLVFFSKRRDVYHVAIYAGRNRIWHAPRTGERVKKERIWTRKVTFGRVR